MNELVQRLSAGSHAVEVSLRPDRTIAALKEQLELGCVQIKFTGTRGGTELGVELDPGACDLSQINCDRQTGQIHLVGSLTLNYIKVRCIADINLQTLAGTGHLEPVEASPPAFT